MTRIAEENVIATVDGRLLLEARVLRMIAGFVIDVVLLLAIYVAAVIVIMDRFFLGTGAQWAVVVGLALGIPLAYGLICFHGWTLGCVLTGTRKVRELTGRMPGPFRMAWHALVVYLFFAFLIVGILTSGSTGGTDMKGASLRRRLTVIRPAIGDAELRSWFQAQGKLPPHSPRETAPPR